METGTTARRVSAPGPPLEDRDHLGHALTVDGLLAPVAPEEIRGVGVTDTVGEPVVEVLAGSLDAKEQAHGVDVELLDRRERGGGREEVRMLGHGHPALHPDDRDEAHAPARRAAEGVGETDLRILDLA